MNGKLYIKKFIRDDGETLSFDAEEIYLSENNTLLVRSDPATTAVEFTEEDGGEMIRQRGATYSQPVSGLIVPKSTEYWALCVRLSRFFILNHTYKIVYIKKDGSMFSINRAWINTGLQIVPVPYESYSTWTIEFKIGDNFWTEYAEDSQGQEIYSNSVELPLLTAGTGGETWSDATQQTLSGIGNYFTIDGTSISASINELELKGDTYQQTYSGANLFNFRDTASVGEVTTVSEDGFITQSKDNSSGTGFAFNNYFTHNLVLDTSTTYAIVVEVQAVSGTGSLVPVSNHSSAQSTEQKEYSFSGLHAGDTIVTQFTTKSSFSGDNGLRGYTRYGAGESGSITYRISVLADTSITPETFVYQPYVGGIPAPNPDYPQDIQVVTGEQTVEVTGKNKINGSYSEISQTVRCTAEASGNGFKITSTSSSGATYVTVPIPNIAALLGQTVTVSYVATGDGIRARFFYLNATGGATSSIGNSETVTLSDSLGSNSGIGVVFYTSNNSSATYNDIQLEIGTATAYEPYQSQSYTIDLGSTELCKIGDYQDYIYKSGNDWYVHKETGKIDLTNTSGWWASGTHTIKNSLTNLGISNIHATGQTTKTEALCNYFTAYPSNTLYQGTNTVGFGISDGFYFSNNDWSLGDFNAFKSNNQILVYYELDTPTNTKITGATLVTQLNALAEAQAYNGKTVYQTSSATMPAILSVELLQSVGGGETWDNVGAVWEEGVGGVQTINVETTQTTYPVWTVTGPCSNPTLQNDTTDTIASFDGMIASGQTLTVNFADNTAYLDSAPVAKYVSGYVSLAPGENVIGFNSDGGSTQTSTISWDNIIN